MLYLCATPIGNLEDITYRVLRVLREADAVWAEDTRRTLQLLNHFEIKKPLVSCHAYNEGAREQMLLEALRLNQCIAYCADAGMPGISDPGALLLHTCIANDLPVTVLPGASAVPMAAVLSGLNCDAFCFFGFLPREKKQREKRMQVLTRTTATMLLYESPLRIPSTLQELAAALGATRPAAVLRELTKLHEEVARGTLAQLAARFSQPPKGECVIAIAGAPEEAAPRADMEALTRALLKLKGEGFGAREAAIAASACMRVQKRLAYERFLELE